MIWIQKEFSLKSKPRGFHLVTSEIERALPELANIQTGLCHLLLMHTSASLTINENADPDVRADMERYFNKTVPENASYFEHTMEGADDMPAHIKSSMLGVSLTTPISMGKFKLGTWQGIYLGEHRNCGGSRRIIATMYGEAAKE